MNSPDSYLGWRIDYAKPAGEPSLVPPGSVSWRIFKNQVALAIGGVCAVLLEFADARIRTGVWEHSAFRTDPIGRSRRTGIAAMVGVFGPRSAAIRVIRGVTNMHGPVKGETPSGEAYSALDPDLLNWVSATAAYGFLTAYDRYVHPLSEADQIRFFEEGAPVSRLYGVTEPLRSLAHFGTMLDQRLPRFEPHAINTEFLDILCSGRAAPGVPKGLQSALVHAAVALLPPAVRDRLELGREHDLSARGEITVKAMARLADRLPDPFSPAAQASRRLGLPWSFPWKSPESQARLLRARALPGATESER